jgi:cellobiose dehydrogenase (acceptor)
LSTATGVIATVEGIDTLIPLSSGGRVIVSAGALMSPQILMWSGIGDSNTLNTLRNSGVMQPSMTPDKWVINPSVGAGLFDNPNTFIELQSPLIQAYKYNYSDVNPTDASLYVNTRSGPYSFAGQLAVFWDSITHADGSVAGFQGTIGSSGYADFTDMQTVTLNVYGTSGLKSRGRVVLDGQGIAAASSETYYSNPQDALDIAGFIRGIFNRLSRGGAFRVLNMDSGWSVQQIAQYITTCKWIVCLHTIFHAPPTAVLLSGLLTFFFQTRLMPAVKSTTGLHLVVWMAHVLMRMPEWSAPRMCMLLMQVSWPR